MKSWEKMKDWIPLLIALLAIAGAIALLELQKPNNPSVSSEIAGLGASEKAGIYPAAREITNPSGFINADNITVSQFVGKKVVLVDFWTYSCINCQRTTPYLNAWHSKYNDKGLQIIGIHSPEFEFEKDYENVKKAVKKFGIEYPVVLDNDYATWAAYKNRYWPRKYLIDIDGFIVYDHIGEGAYEETELKIQELLEERMERLGMNESISIQIEREKGFDAVPKTPEIYFGSARNELFANGMQFTTGIQTHAEPNETQANRFYLSGEWNVQPEYAENNGSAAIILHYRAKSVYFVAQGEATVEITIDGMPLKAKGSDVFELDGKTLFKTGDSRLYSLVEEPSYGEHVLRLDIKGNLKAYTFTFG